MDPFVTLAGEGGPSGPLDPRTGATGRGLEKAGGEGVRLLLRHDADPLVQPGGLDPVPADRTAAPVTRTRSSPSRRLAWGVETRVPRL